MKTTKFSALAWSRANNLASAFGHWWANRWEGAPTQAQIEAAKAAYGKYERLAEEESKLKGLVEKARATHDAAYTAVYSKQWPDGPSAAENGVYSNARMVLRELEDSLQPVTRRLEEALEALPLIDPSLLAPVSAEAVAKAAVANAPKDALGWIGLTPVVDDSGWMSHGTGRGVVSWAVREDGFITIDIERPRPGRPEGSREGVTVLFLTLTGPGPDAKAVAGIPLGGGDRDAPPLCRHWEWLLKCGVALGVESVVREAMPPTVRRAFEARKEEMAAYARSGGSMNTGDSNFQDAERRAQAHLEAADKEIISLSKPLPYNRRQRAAMGEL